jgi:O-antigen biosynthesis protein
VLEQVKGLKRIDNPENLGFVHSCNRGIAAAQGEYIYFLNNDTELHPQALEQLLLVCEQDPQVGAVGSKLIYPDGSLQEAGGIIWQDASGWNYGRNENVYAPQYNYLRPVDYCSIRHQLGLKVMYQPKSVVVHYEGISCGTELTNGIKRYQSINMAKFKQKWAAELQDYPVNHAQTGVEAASRRNLGKKTILVIDIYAPCYDKESGARRLWQLMQIFKQLNFHVIFVPDNGVKEQPYIDKLQNLQIEVLYTQEGYGNSMLQQVEERLPLVDIAWVCRPELYEKYADLIRQNSQIKLVYDMIDLHYLRMKRAWELSPQSRTIENMCQWVRMQARELKASQEADLTVTITSVEQKVLQQQQVNNLAVIPNLHLPYQGDKPDFEQREGLLFIGSYNHPPNIDAVKWLCWEIMPLVWEQLPDIKVTLLGNQPTEEVTALANDQVTVTGYVADVTPYFLSHRVFVAPLRYGAGMKGKIGQSLEYGLPIVSTEIGVEGMDLNDEQNVLVAKQTEEFARQIIKLYGDKTLWDRLASYSERAIAPYAPEIVKEELHQVLGNLLPTLKTTQKLPN